MERNQSGATQLTLKRDGMIVFLLMDLKLVMKINPVKELNVAQEINAMDTEDSRPSQYQEKHAKHGALSHHKSIRTLLKRNQMLD